MNPSFENFDTCPNNLDQVHFVQPWIGYATPDYFNSCGTLAPYNMWGYQVARTGTGYVGLAAYAYYYNGSCANCREYISGQLWDTLKRNVTYCVEFYASLSNCSFWAVNQLGVYLSQNPVVYDNQGDTLSKIPQVVLDTSFILLDTSSWVKISGTYTASGGEKFLMLGNFHADNETDTISNLGICIVAYYYIDDVSVYELQECNAGEDVSICYKDSITLGTTAAANVLYEWIPTSGLSNASVANPLASPDTSTVYILKQTECDAVLFDTVRVIVNRDCHTAPSIMVPTVVTSSQAFFIRGLESNSQLDIYDLRGRLIFASDDYQNDFIFSHEEQAFYIAVLTRPDGEQWCEKVFVVTE